MQWPARGFLILYGGPGTGKSFGAAWTVREYIKNGVSDPLDKKTWESAERAGDNAIWINAQEVTEVTPDRTLLPKACSARLLIMDDLGREEDIKAGNAAVRVVVSKRYDAKLATIITTELSLSDIRKRYGRYVADRLAEDFRDGGALIDCGDASMRMAGEFECF
jgi:DNA replication protein DnaC